MPTKSSKKKTTSSKATPKSKVVSKAVQEVISDPELEKQLNFIGSRSGTKFSKVLKTKTGYELNAELNPSFVRPMVEESRWEEGSLMHRLVLSDQEKALRQRLSNARLKAQINQIEKGISITYRDKLENVSLDLREKPADESKALELYSRTEKEYQNTGIYGTALDLLSNFASQGFYNDSTDPEVKDYFDAWVRDTDFLYTTKRIFHSLFKYNVCYILKATGAYEPNANGVSSIPGKSPDGGKSVKARDYHFLNAYYQKNGGVGLDWETYSQLYDELFPASRNHKEKGAAGGVPILYTILDPKYIELRSSGFFNKYGVTITSKGLAPVKDLQKAVEDGKASKSEASALKLLPSGMKKAAEEGEPYTFTEDEVSVIFLRKDDYEVYAKPRGSRAFDSFDFKDELKKADFASIDGIYNYILKITVGDKDNPVTDQTVLTKLAEAFNTPQKAFSVVWNHTLKIEKITTPEVGDILGKSKYEPVESDITAALGMARAIIDGGAPLSGEAAVLSAKALRSEIEAARDEVERWIYQEYEIVAAGAGFNVYPVVRWKRSSLNTDSDAVTINSYLQIADRRMASIETIIRELGFDFGTEVTRMTGELPLVQQGILLKGSPYQQTGMPAATPSGGRPTGQPKVTKAPVDQTKVVKRNSKAPTPGESAEESLDPTLVEELIKSLSLFDDDTREKLMAELAKLKSTMDTPQSTMVEANGEIDDIANEFLIMAEDADTGTQEVVTSLDPAVNKASTEE